MIAKQPNRFPISRKGYDQQYVDAILEDFNREIIDLKKQNAALLNSMSIYEQKIDTLIYNNRQLEEEKLKDNLKITDIFTVAAKIAETTEQIAKSNAKEIVSTAKEEAEKIKQAAQKDLDAARQLIVSLCQNAQTIQKNIGEYAVDANIQLAELIKSLNKTIDDIPVSLSDPITEKLPIPDKIYNPEPETISDVITEAITKATEAAKTIPEADNENKTDVYTEFFEKWNHL